MAGAGLIGRRHVEAILRCSGAVLAGVADPSEDAAAWAASAGVPHHRTLGALLSEGPDGVVVATPNQLHVEQGLACVAAGVPALIEKPLASDVASARALVRTAERQGVPILVGHHRRHNPLVAAAKARIEAGALGRIVAVQGTCWLCKPDDYFDVTWRTRPGAGPVLINLIHDIDLLRHLCGEVVAVQAMASGAVRGHAVEDTAAILLAFEGGVLGTVTVSDAVTAPWSWELTAGENPAYPKTDESCYLIGGTRGSLEIPASRVWRNPGARGWWEPIGAETYPVAPLDPLDAQIAHFCCVILGQELPLVSGREGLRTLAVIEAIHQAAATGQRVAPDPGL